MLYYICDVCDMGIYFDREREYDTCPYCEAQYSYRVGWSDNPRNNFEYQVLGNVKLIRNRRIGKPSSSDLEESRFES